MDRLARHLPSSARASVELVKEGVRAQGQRLLAEITLDVNGVILRSEERGANARAAMDASVDVMDRRIDKYKGKNYRTEQAKRRVRRGRARAAAAEGLEEAGEPIDGVVVKYKAFSVKPMTVDEAIFQMELLGHSFFLFYNSESQIYNVVYVRKDGAYGLIQPEPPL
ncbi:MAG: HPF/RaiA family ribosome-associated protein [SAR202 cluster bacterium]|nr:HPF/RaiA family ribosome-associated protein [SAR202 cluster bacterium]